DGTVDEVEERARAQQRERQLAPPGRQERRCLCSDTHWLLSFPGPHSSSVSPTDMPPPKPASRTLSPGRRSPVRHALSRVIGIDAAPVLPRSVTVVCAVAFDRPSSVTSWATRFPLAWCGIRWVISSGATA